MSDSAPERPTMAWRLTSALTMGIAGSISRAFYYGCNKVEVIGLERFLEILDRRKDVDSRERGLITVSNHISVLDDPLMWGILPFKYAFNPDNHRWSLGAYDVCFLNKPLCTFFSLGQVLPTHRKEHSPFGGLFQPTMTQAIRLLSSRSSFSTPPTSSSSVSSRNSSASTSDLADPFTSGSLTYSTNGTDVFPAPSAYLNRKHSWIHIFPEGRVHQHPLKSLRYFRWGVSRLILESEPLPEIVPMFIDGNQQIMHESREWPRFIPRVGKKVTIAFGEAVDGEKVFGDARRRWQRLVRLQREALRDRGEPDGMEMGVLTEGLMHCEEAVALRLEVTRLVRDEVLKVRRSLGLPDEDPKNGLVATWAKEGGKGEGKMEDDSWVKDV